jgi:hypothetical protein
VRSHEFRDACAALALGQRGALAVALPSVQSLALLVGLLTDNFDALRAGRHGAVGSVTAPSEWRRGTRRKDGRVHAAQHLFSAAPMLMLIVSNLL